MEPHEEMQKFVGNTDAITDSVRQDNPHEEVKKTVVNEGDASVTFSQPTTSPHLTIINQQSTQQPSPLRSVNPFLIADAADKSPGLAGFLSFLFTGLGQLYNGQIGKGLVAMFFWLFFGGVTISGEAVGPVALVFLWAWSIFDAYSTAKRKRLNWQMILYDR